MGSGFSGIGSVPAFNPDNEAYGQPAYEDRLQVAAVWGSADHGVELSGGEIDGHYYLTGKDARRLAELLIEAAGEDEQQRSTLEGYIADLRSRPAPMRDFIQLDGWANCPAGDSIMVPDDDGDVRFAGPTREPQRSDTTVRILVARGANPADVARLIRKQLAWIEEPDGPVSPGQWDTPPF